MAASNRRFLSLMLLAFVLIACDAKAQGSAVTDATMDAIERQLEMSSHEQLLVLTQSRDVAVNEFTTDGCSGGLSIAWEQLSARFPDFAQRHGEEPPWQACCVAHDRQYHTGGLRPRSPTESFEQRREADLQLKTCVAGTAAERSDALQDVYGLTEAQIGALYEFLSELMYRAVRLGGIPCTAAPWRWGYGWPSC